MQEFTQLQQHVFPTYFAGQASLVALTAATYPPASLYSLAKSRAFWIVHLPLGVNLAVAGANALVYGPKTGEAMLERQKLRAKASQDASHGTTTSGAEPGEAMKKVKKEFSKNHAMAIHLNAIGMAATIWYGVGLASKIRFVP